MTNHGRDGRSIRRVATGQAEDGSSVIVSDTSVAPIEAPALPGARFFSLWGADKLPGLPNDGTLPSYRTWFPPDGGYRFELIEIPPDGAPKPSGAASAEAVAETKRLLPGLVEAMDPKHPGWHATDTVDLIYVLSGECVLKLDSGETTRLEAGDTLIQTGSRHAWSNPGDVPCALLAVSLGVKRDG